MPRAQRRAQDCDRQDALSRLAQAESFVEVGELVMAADDQSIGLPGVAAALAVLAGVAASDAACCVRLRTRARGQDHGEAIELLATVHPHGSEMAKDLRRLLARKDDAHYGLHMVGRGDAVKMLRWSKRMCELARRLVETG